MTVFDPHPCQLGEGPLWLPEHQTLIWFDILNRQMRARTGDATQVWQFDRHFSAAGRVDKDTLILASEDALWRFDLTTDAQTKLCPLEEDNPLTRSNDGRADPWGGFWIGTMGHQTQAQAGAIYRYYKGELRKLFGDLTIPNACCFTPDGTEAVFCDTADNLVKRVALDADGWPVGDPRVWLDLSGLGYGVDGAVIDADGNFWNAQWNGWRVACYAPDGTMIREIAVGGAHSSCPAFGGDDLTTLFCTPAGGRVTDEDRGRAAEQGKGFFEENVAKGQTEHRVIL